MLGAVGHGPSRGAGVVVGSHVSENQAFSMTRHVSQPEKSLLWTLSC